MNATKLLPALFALTALTIGCNAIGAPASPSPQAPTPAAPTPAAPTPAAPTPGAPSPTPPADPPATGPADLSGRDFLSVDVRVGGEPLTLVPNTRIRLSFQDGQLGASAGCNHFGATYRIDGDRLLVDGGSMTEMGCDGPRHAQDDWLFGFLGADPTFTLSGNDLVLTVDDADTTITLLDTEVAEPDQPLTDRTWNLTSIITGDAVSSVPADVIANILFKADGSLDVRPGCNTGGGTYAVEGDTITFGDIFLTRMACMGAPGQVEQWVLDVLSAEGGVTYAIDADSLTLTAGELGLQFTAATDLGG